MLRNLLLCISLLISEHVYWYNGPSQLFFLAGYAHGLEFYQKSVYWIFNLNILEPQQKRQVFVIFLMSKSRTNSRRSLVCYSFIIKLSPLFSLVTKLTTPIAWVSYTRNKKHSHIYVSLSILMCELCLILDSKLYAYLTHVRMTWSFLKAIFDHQAW